MTQAKGKNEEAAEEDITIDMTSAKTMEPLPINQSYLAAVSAWAPGKSGSGGRKVHYELTVVEPSEFVNRKLIEDLSLENEYTLGRLQTMLVALGKSLEEVRSPSFKLPKAEDMVGLQCTVRVRIEESEEFGDRNRIRSIRPATAYKEAATY